MILSSKSWLLSLAFPVLALSQKSSETDRVADVHGRFMDMLEESLSKGVQSTSNLWAQDGASLNALKSAMDLEDKRLSDFSDTSMALMAKEAATSNNGEGQDPTSHAEALQDALKLEWIRVHSDSAVLVSKRFIDKTSLSNLFRGLGRARSVDESLTALATTWKETQKQSIDSLSQNSAVLRAQVNEFLEKSPKANAASNEFVEGQGAYLKLLEKELAAKTSFASFKSKVLAAKGQSNWEIRRLNRQLRRTKDPMTKETYKRAIQQHENNINTIEESVADLRLAYENLLHGMATDNANLAKSLKTANVNFDAIKVANLRVKLEKASAQARKFDANVKKLEKFTPRLFRRTLFSFGIGTISLVGIVSLLAILFM